MNVIAIVPARYASTRFPGKPLIDINGKSMICRVCEQSRKAFDTVYVATDDERIYQHVIDLGFNVVMTSANHQSGTDRCAEALNTIEKLENRTFEIVVNVQGDEPFILPEQLQQVILPFSNSSTQITTLIKKITDLNELIDTNKPKVVINKNKQAIYFSRNIIPHIRNIAINDYLNHHVFYKHIGLYAYRSSILREITKLNIGILEKVESLEQLRWIEHGYTITTIETNFETIAIDTPDDLRNLKK